MFKYTLTICFLLLATFEIGTLSAGRSGSGRSGSGRSGSSSRGDYGRRGYGGYGEQQIPTQPPVQTPKEYLDNKSGFSTFGIISIIFVIIVFCLAFYYGIMCYPILCGEEKKYRFMDVSSTITSAMQSTATSRSIQSMEILHMDSKH